MFTVDNSLWVLVDLQAKLLRAVPAGEALVASTLKLTRGLSALKVPMMYTEQNPDGLGPTVGEVAELLPGMPIIKFSFSCCGERAFTEKLRRFGRSQIILSGIETHVCVYQTAADLVAAGREVQVVADACASRTPENNAIGLGRIRDAGATLTGVECLLFELLKVAEGKAFKQILEVVK